MVPTDVIREIFRKKVFIHESPTRKHSARFVAGKHDGDFAVLIPEEGTVESQTPKLT